MGVVKIEGPTREAQYLEAHDGHTTGRGGLGAPPPSYVEKRGAAAAHLVATMGMLHVPSGSINIVPGRCEFSLDIRATTNDVRDACIDDVLAELRRICERRGLHCRIEETVRASAAPSDPAWQARWERAVQRTGLPVHHMPSGAGHDAMKLHEVMPQAMLFMRGGNAGISHTSPSACSPGFSSAWPSSLCSADLLPSAA